MNEIPNIHNIVIVSVNVKNQSISLCFIAKFINCSISGARGSINLAMRHASQSVNVKYILCIHYESSSVHLLSLNSKTNVLMCSSEYKVLFRKLQKLEI